MKAIPNKIWYKRIQSQFLVSSVMMIFLITGLRADIKEPDKLPVPFEPSHPQVVEAMIKMANLAPEDIVFDPGCGDGRIVISAVRKSGAKGVCIDLSPQRIQEAEEKVKDFGLSEKIGLIVGDSLQQDFSKASVVMLYMLTKFNKKLRPILLKQLKPGTRIVAHGFHMGAWKPDKILPHHKARRKAIYYWEVPAQVEGKWRLQTKIASKGHVRYKLELKQSFQEISGSLSLRDANAWLSKGRLKGKKIDFTLKGVFDGQKRILHFSGTVSGNRMKGIQKMLAKDGTVLNENTWEAVKK